MANDALKAALLERAKREKAKRQQATPNTDIPEGMFLNPQTGQMTNREMLKANSPTDAAGAFVGGSIQGYAMNTADEALGAATGAIDGGGEEAVNFRREQARAAFDAAQESHPVAYGIGRVAGAVTNPLSMLAKARTIKGAAALAGGEGFVDAFAGGEGSFADRAKKGVVGGGTSLIAGGIMAGAVRGGQNLLKKPSVRPTIAALRTTKNKAYAAVRKAGVNFDGNDTQAMFQRLNRKAQSARWDLDDISDTDKAAFDALRTIERINTRAQSGQPISLNRLDQSRQKLWDIYNGSDNPFVLEAIREIDNTIAARAQGNALLATARDANAKMSKAELLENAFRKARLQTASTGSGGNILNKYKQAITRIVTTPREAKWFSDEELMLMENFIYGTNAEQALRRIGKLAPGGNGLMTALNVYAASVDPSMLAITAGATLAKGSADSAGIKGSEAILDAVSTGVIKSPEVGSNLGQVAIGAGTAARERR